MRVSLKWLHVFEKGKKRKKTCDIFMFFAVEIIDWYIPHFGHSQLYIIVYHSCSKLKLQKYLRGILFLNFASCELLIYHAWIYSSIEYYDWKVQWLLNPICLLHFSNFWLQFMLCTVKCGGVFWPYFNISLLHYMLPGLLVEVMNKKQNKCI